MPGAGRASRRTATYAKNGRSGRTRLAVVDHPQRLIDHVFAEVVAVLRPTGGCRHVVVDHDLGMELVGLAFEEAVVAIEAARQRPLVERARRRHVPVGARCHLPVQNVA